MTDDDHGITLADIIGNRGVIMPAADFTFNPPPFDDKPPVDSPTIGRP